MNVLQNFKSDMLIKLRICISMPYSSTIQINALSFLRIPYILSGV